jgi:hypothetical protein
MIAAGYKKGKARFTIKTISTAFIESKNNVSGGIWATSLCVAVWP